jgi:hypothetical protein
MKRNGVSAESNKPPKYSATIIAHGSNRRNQTIKNAIVNLYGELENKAHNDLYGFDREVRRKMVPLFGDVYERILTILETQIILISGCNFSDTCISSRGNSIDTILCDSDYALKEIFEKSLIYYNKMYDIADSIKYTCIVLRFTRLYYFYSIFQKMQKIYPDNFSNLDSDNFYLNFLIFFNALTRSESKIQKYWKSVLAGASSILTNLEIIRPFIEEHDIKIVNIIRDNLKNFIEYIEDVKTKVINKDANFNDITPIFGRHHITESTSIKELQLTDPTGFHRGIHLFEGDMSVVIAHASELDKMSKTYPENTAQIINEYIRNQSQMINNNIFELILNKLMETMQTNENITSAHVLLLIILTNYHNTNLIPVLDFSCNDTIFDEETSYLRAPKRKDSFGGKTNKRKTVNKRKQTKRRKSKSTYA